MNLALLILVALALGCILGRYCAASAHLEVVGTLPSSEPRLGPDTLGEKIGEGGMGVVYKARHERLARPIAIKLLPKDRAGRREQERFEREVRLTSLLTHPNTISVFDSGRTSEGNV